MDLIPSDNNMECIEDESAQQLLHPCTSDIGESSQHLLYPCTSVTGDIFGDPEVLPRVGDQYQAQIPPLLAEYDHSQLVKKPDKEVMVNILNSFFLGLPIPIMWVHDEVENLKQDVVDVLCSQADGVNINGLVKLENSEECQISLNDENANIKVEPLNTALGDGKGGEMSGLQLEDDKMDVDLILPQDRKAQLDQRGKGYCPLPGSLGESWSDIEHDGLLLGLYIFGKNFLLVKKFVESKEMGDILSFYYGKFYQSNGYHKWSECRKTRSRRCIHGQRIFTGGRQQELLSRLFPRVAEECQTMLVEVSRTFGEGKISLEDYVFTLKDAVGINMLIEEVGIGRGKQDLTGIALEPIKTNQVFPLRPELPNGKACSSLSSRDIIKFLTGDFRLSKSRSSDLFWEAVWPRLLARGWRSEQPKDHGVSGLKHSLVFLIPGVKKFSRRKLVKGDHYFDYISDVLNKVASDPRLLELETEAAKGSGHIKEQRRDPQIKQDPDGLSNLQRHCYLQPRTSNFNRDLMKFTIVDTSLVHGEERSKVKLLKSLPIDNTNVSSSSCLSCETDQDISEEWEDEAEEINTSNPLEDVTARGACADSAECVTSILDYGVPADPSIAAVENHEGQSTGVYDDEQSTKKMKYQFSRNAKSGHSKYLAPVTRQQLTASGNEDSRHSRESKLNEENSHFQSNSPDACENMPFQGGPSQNLSSTCSSAQGTCPGGSNEGTLNENCLEAELLPEKPLPLPLIDLNLPHIPPDFGTDEPFAMDMVHNHDNPCANKLSTPSETSEQPEPLKLSDGGASIEQQSIMNGRRQSTRNRPLTTKALEALACGFFNTKRKRKRVEALPQKNSMSRSSQRVCERTIFDIAGSRIEEERLDGVFRSNTDMGGESQV